MTEETKQNEVTDVLEDVDVEGVTESAENTEEPPMQDTVRAETVNIEQGGAQNVVADKITVNQGGIAHAEGRFIDVTEGGIAVAMGENITVTDGAAVVVAANNVKMTDGLAILVAANEISGENVKVIIDIKAAAFFALIFGAVVGVFKMLLRRRD
ncbi:MAG: hypothetical protein P1S60_01140 [Anaerolineae bacterium]|nr:hypothetical protein [Anaerolineae bacterium]